MKRTRRQLAGWLFALLVLVALPYSSAQTACAEAAIRPTPRLGQTLVLADFDNDGQLDRARIASSGLNSSVEIQLGLTGVSAWLHFENLNGAPGALLSEDLDADGPAVISIGWGMRHMILCARFGAGWVHLPATAEAWR